MNIPITPITPLSSHDRKSDEGPLSERKPLDTKVTKVKGFVLERISHARGGLLPSATAPQIVMGLLPGVEPGKWEQSPKNKRKSRLRRTPLVRYVPIGLRPVDPEGGINALMQFILFVPGFAELFFFTPRSFQPFQEFIDQYHQDQQEGKGVSTANGTSLFRFLSVKVPELCLHDIFQFLVKAIQSKWEIKKNLDEALKNERPADLFIIESSMKKQLFVEPHLGYDLDAFIELRPDRVTANFIAYVKINGTWYQCDDERITLIRSDSLTIPLGRAILLHYKQIAFGKTGWI